MPPVSRKNLFSTLSHVILKKKKPLYLDPDIRDDVAAFEENADGIWKRLDRKYGDEGTFDNH